MPAIDTDNLKLTDFLDLPMLQEIQDNFTAMANVKATITDAHGNLLTQAGPSPEFLRRQDAIAASGQIPAGTPHGAEYIAPIVVDHHQLGSVRMAADGVAVRPAVIQFLHLLANAIARLCHQEYQLRQRINELTAVYGVAMMLSDGGSMERVLQRMVQVVADVMGTRSASVRLLDPEHDQLVIKAVHNLSFQYINKGPVRLSTAMIDLEALSPKGYEFVRNLAEDPRGHYPDEARREGIISMLSAGMRFHGKAVGVIRVYTDHEQTFTVNQINLLKAIAAQAAAVIENTRLREEASQAQALERQVQMAAQVQQRMIPRSPPSTPGVDIASVYVPCYELGGDFYDFIELPYDNLALVIADVSGKGVPASLTMAAVRAALRAQVDNVYYLYEVIRRINLMLVRDNLVGEFVTLFYGVLDGRNRRFTYCNAGHPPALVLREGKIIQLGSDNMVLGVNRDEKYTQSLFDLRSGDFLFLYTDGLPDAMNPRQETFGRQRIQDVFIRGGDSAQTVIHNILEAMHEFTGDARRNDDVTMIVAKIN